MRDAEFHLLVAACGASINDRALAAPPVGIRWDRMLALANRHRVQAICWNSLRPFADRIPHGIAASLQAQARDIVVANLRAAAECLRLRQSFESVGVPLLFLKGLTLAALAYRDPFLKLGIDIDLLVDPDRLTDAAGALRAAGYAPVIPARSDDEILHHWHSAHKESVWHHSTGGFQIDLHTRLADHPAMLSGLSAVSPSQAVTVANGVTLPTLTNDELFAYLCVHGASSAWFRLKWITDFAAWLRRMGVGQVARMYDRSQQLGAGRAAGQALLLADRLYGIGLEDSLRERLAAVPAVRWLVRLAERQLLNPAEPTERLLGTATIHLTQLGLQPGWRFKSSEAARQLRELIGAA